MPPDQAPAPASHVLPGVDGGAQEEAMAGLHESYARPLLAYLQQLEREALDAEELVQAFIASAVTQDLLRKDDWQEKRFRRTLLSAFTTWLSDVQGRNGDGNTAEAGAAYDREWAGAVLGRAMQQVRNLYDHEGRIPVFEALRGVLPGGGETPPYARIAQDFGMTKEAVNGEAQELRAACAEFLRAEVTRTVADTELVEEETQYLLQLIREEG